jgi:hypothetical protein
MAKDTVCLGLVELHVDLDQQRPVDNPKTLVREAAARDGASRTSTVKAILASADLADVDVLVFPGWTMTGQALPDWVPKLAGSRTVVIEMDEGDGAEEAGGKMRRANAPWPAWTTYLVHGGNAQVEGVRQRFAESDDATPDSCASLVGELSAIGGARSFGDPTLGRVGMMVCGEINAIYTPVSKPAEFPEGFPTLDLVLNPSHTYTPLRAMHAKRRALSDRGAVLATTAHVHSQWNRNGETGPRVNAAAKVFVDGEEIERNEERAVRFDGGKVLVFEVPARGATGSRGAGARGSRP